MLNGTNEAFTCYVHTYAPLVQCITFSFNAVFVSADIVQIRKKRYIIKYKHKGFKVTKSKSLQFFFVVYNRV